eukprot:c25794_g1_i1 orf=322-2274(-)
MEAAKTAFSVMGACAFGLTFVPLPLRSKLEACIRDLWEKLFITADPFAYVEVSCKSKGIDTSAVQNAIQYGRNISNCNPFYEEVGLYLGSLNIEFETRRVCVYGMDRDDEHDGSNHDAPKLVFGLPLNETLADTFEGAQLSWKHTVTSTGGYRSSGGHSDEDADNVFTLTMLKSDKRRLLRPYLHHISTVAHEIRRRNTLRTLYTNGRHGSHWSPVTFRHPSTFDTIALAGDLAERIQADLKAFSESEEYYHSIGRAWKRGYLLYGPPGTGKSSLIAAIANFMHYDIYDLELTNVFDNSLLKTLLMQTTRKSIIVIEDIDCSMSKGVPERPQDFGGFFHQKEIYNDASQSRSQGLTLSGLLNFADGLLSCFGEERIFIFTTNHKERLDSALLRCGRMDMHILLSYCTFSAFKKLAFNYLGIKNHALYGELERAMEPGAKITPASIAEILISERKDPDEAIKLVITAVKAAEPLDSGDKGQVMAATNTSEPLDSRKKGQRVQSGDSEESSDEGCEKVAVEKGQELHATSTNGIMGCPQKMQSEDFNGPSDEGFGKPIGNHQQVIAATAVANPFDNGNKELQRKLQIEDSEGLFDEGVEKLAGNQGQVMPITYAADLLDNGQRGIRRKIQSEDSEGSSDEGVEKPKKVSKTS